MKEFVKRDLHNVYKEEIEAWFIYLDQQEFGKKLEEQMRNEVERYMEDKKTIEDLVNEAFPQPKIEWENNTLLKL
jgi:nucleoid-associated protein YejK